MGKISKKKIKDIATLWVGNILMETELQLACEETVLTQDQIAMLQEEVFIIANKLLKGREYGLGSSENIVNYVLTALQNKE